jgi:hypothetical protein
VSLSHFVSGRAEEEEEMSEEERWMMTDKARTDTSSSH